MCSLTTYCPRITCPSIRSASAGSFAGAAAPRCRSRFFFDGSGGGEARAAGVAGASSVRAPAESGAKTRLQNFGEHPPLLRLYERVLQIGARLVGRAHAEPASELGRATDLVGDQHALLDDRLRQLGVARTGRRRASRTPAVR